MKLKLIKFVVVLLLLNLLLSCSKRIERTGYFLSYDKLQKVKINYTTEQGVLTILGEPITKSLYGPKNYFYIERQYKQFGVFNLRLEAQTIIAFEFDCTHKLKRVRIYNKKDTSDLEYDSDSIIIKDKRIGIIEQFSNNVGKFTSKAQKSVR